MICAISAAAGSTANKDRMFRGASRVAEVNTYSYGESGPMDAGVLCLDLDRDGRMDILHWTYDIDEQEAQVVLHRNAQQNLATSPEFENYTLIHYPGSMFTLLPTDLDGDGDLDLVTSTAQKTASGPWPFYYMNDGGMPPVFSASASLTSTTTQIGWSAAAGDLDGDGAPDFIAGLLSRSYGLSWWGNDLATSGQATTRTLIGDRITQDLAVADLNGDGRLDVLSLAEATFEDPSEVGWAAYWYRNEGGSPPAFTEQMIDYAAPTAPIFSADIDSDGDLDVFFEGNCYYENDGATSPTFTARTYAPQYGKHYIKPWLAADLDDDGDLDLVASPLSTTGNPTGLPTGLAWFENNGARPPSFTEHKIYVADFDYRSVAAADLDGDADIDLVALTATEVYWLENDPIRNAVGAAQWTLME